MAAAAPGEGDPAALRAQVRFLEDNVRRLNEALSAQQLAAGDTPCASAGQTFLEGVQEGDPLPPWLVDERYLSPLLLAYDQRLAASGASERATAQEASRLRARVDEVVAENDALAAEAKAKQALEATIVNMTAQCNQLVTQIHLIPKHIMMLSQ